MPNLNDFDVVENLESMRMSFAWKCVDEATAVLGDYETLSRKIASLTKANGLGQTLAFLYSKAKNANAHELLMEQIGKYLAHMNLIPNNFDADKTRLMEAFVKLPQCGRIQAESELLAMFEWLRRFASGRTGK